MHWGRGVQRQAGPEGSADRGERRLESRIARKCRATRQRDHRIAPVSADTLSREPGDPKRSTRAGALKDLPVEPRSVLVSGATWSLEPRRPKRTTRAGALGTGVSKAEPCAPFTQPCCAARTLRAPPALEAPARASGFPVAPLVGLCVGERFGGVETLGRERASSPHGLWCHISPKSACFFPEETNWSAVEVR